MCSHLFLDRCRHFSDILHITENENSIRQESPSLKLQITRGVWPIRPFHSRSVLFSMSSNRKLNNLLKQQKYWNIESLSLWPLRKLIK